MKKSFLFTELITFLSAFRQIIVRAENHLKRTKLPIQFYSEKNSKTILMQLECPLLKK